jgi:hypothetical protein
VLVASNRRWTTFLGAAAVGDYVGALVLVSACAGSGSSADTPADDAGATFDAEAGPAAACALAPSCANALGAPSHPTPRPDLDQGLPDAGTDASIPSSVPGVDGCQDAQLRMRVESVTTYAGGAQIYCIVTATDGATSEAAITTKTKSLGNGETDYFDPQSAMFWGQAALHRTTDNLTITYNCLEVVDNAVWSSALQALGAAAMQAGGVAGPYGWAFGAASAGAQAAAAALQAASGDKLVFNTQQTIDRSELLDLTNGRTWALRKSGGGWPYQWDWEIAIESWGCANGSGER